MENLKTNYSIYIIALIGLVGVIITAVVTYQVTIRQTSFKLIETKLHTLNSKKDKLEAVKAEIYDRKIDVSNGLDNSDEAMMSRYVDKILLDINSMLRISEYLDDRFISELKDFSKRISGYIQNSKTSNSAEFDSSQISADIQQLPIIDDKIKTELDSKLREIIFEIEELVKSK